MDGVQRWKKLTQRSEILLFARDLVSATIRTFARITVSKGNLNTALISHNDNDNDNDNVINKRIRRA